MSDNEEQLVAGRQPAKKVSKMRVVTHKRPTHKENASADLEDCTGLTQPPNINTELVSGSELNMQATQVAHAPKAPQNVEKIKSKSKNQVHHINQPRK